MQSMEWKNRGDRYGIVAVAFHWVMALTVFALFGLGLYMVELSYYDSLYNKLPHWHRSTGVLLGGALVLRLLWRWWSPPPQPLASHTLMERRMAALVHWALYLLLFAMVISGYLISAADGRGFSVFGWFEMPALIERTPNLEDRAGAVHEWLAWALIVLAVLHASAALKHHVIDRDATLKRMLGRAQ